MMKIEAGGAKCVRETEQLQELFHCLQSVDAAILGAPRGTRRWIDLLATHEFVFRRYRGVDVF